MFVDIVYQLGNQDFNPLHIELLTKKRTPGSNKFPNQNLRQISQGVMSYDLVYKKNTKKNIQKLLLDVLNYIKEGKMFADVRCA